MASKDETRRTTIYINGDAADQTIKQLTSSSSKLKNELALLVPGTDAFIEKSRELREVNEHLANIKEDVQGVELSMESLKGALETLGVAFSAEAVIEFGKELFNLETRADGIHNAFVKIGNTEGYLEKLRASSKGLIEDLDLEKIATKANNANIPIEKMGIFLKFAQQRAEDTGESVTELTEKLIEGLGKGTPKALAGLGVNVSEVKREFKETGDMVTAVANIINKEMGSAGQDVETFGDRVGETKTKWENFLDKIASGWKKIFTPELADTDEIEKQTSKELKQFDGYEKFKDDQLQIAISKQQFREKLYAKEYAKARKSLDDAQKASTAKGGDVYTDTSDEEAQLKKSAEEYQGVTNALRALNKEKEKRGAKSSDGSLEAIDQEIARLKALQNQLSSTSVEYKKYEALIKVQQDKRDAITGKKKEDKKGDAERAAALKEFNDLAIAQKQFDAAELADTMSKNDKEIQLLENKYDVFIQKEKNFLTKKGATRKQLATTNANIQTLETQKEQAVIDLRIKQEAEVTNKINAFREQMSGKLATELQKEIDQINHFYDTQKKDIGNDPGLDAKLEADRAKDITDAKIREEKRFKDEKLKLDEANGADPGKKDEVEKARINKKYDDEINALKAKYSKELQATKEFQDEIAKINHQRSGELSKIDHEEIKQVQDAAIESAQQIASATFEIAANNRHAQSDAQITQLEKEKNTELSNANLTESQKSAINDKYAKQESDLKKQAWEDDKQASLEQAIINGALAITKTFVSYGFTPAGIIAAAAQAVATGTQIAVIENQPTPTFADGGYSAVDYNQPGGFVKKPTLFANSASKRSFIAGEGNKTEYIVSSKQLQDPMIANFVGMLEANRGIKKFESGGFSNPAAAGSKGVSRSGSGGGSPGGSINETNQLLRELTVHFGNFANKPWDFNNRAYELYTSKVNDTRNNANS